MTAKDKAELMRRLRQSRKRDGLVQYVVWIPDTKEARAKVTRYAARLALGSRGSRDE